MAGKNEKKVDKKQQNDGQTGSSGPKGGVKRKTDDKPTVSRKSKVTKTYKSKDTSIKAGKKVGEKIPAKNDENDTSTTGSKTDKNEVIKTKSAGKNQKKVDKKQNDGQADGPKANKTTSVKAGKKVGEKNPTKTDESSEAIKTKSAGKNEKKVDKKQQNDCQTGGPKTGVKRKMDDKPKVKKPKVTKTNKTTSVKADRDAGKKVADKIQTKTDENKAQTSKTDENDTSTAGKTDENEECSIKIPIENGFQFFQPCEKPKLTPEVEEFYLEMMRKCQCLQDDPELYLDIYGLMPKIVTPTTKKDNYFS